MLYYLGSIAAIALVVLLNKILDGHKTFKLTDSLHALQIFKQDCPLQTATDTFIDLENQCALFLLKDDQRIGFLKCHGNGYVCRVLKPQDFSAAKIEPERGNISLRLSFNDFGMAAISLWFIQSAENRSFVDHLQQLTALPTSSQGAA